MNFSLFHFLHWFNYSSLYFGCPSVSVVMLLFIIDCWFIGEDNSYQRTSIIQLYWSVSPSVMLQKTNMTNELFKICWLPCLFEILIQSTFLPCQIHLPNIKTNWYHLFKTHLLHRIIHVESKVRFVVKNNKS